VPYLPPAGYLTTAETEIKRSRFITTVGRTDTEAAARALITQTRSSYPDARHHCIAFRLDDGQSATAHSSDDGEPSGTAGMPMLHCLLAADLINITAIVTRYFGGIKLGAAGLTRAYGGCVAQAIAGIPLVERQTRRIWAVRIPHDSAGVTQEDLLRAGATIHDISYDATGVKLRLSATTDMTDLVARITHGHLVPMPDSVETIEVPVLPT
jgi:uncharacterized YigZ family protein